MQLLCNRRCVLYPANCIWLFTFNPFSYKIKLLIIICFADVKGCNFLLVCMCVTMTVRHGPKWCALGRASASASLLIVLLWAVRASSLYLALTKARELAMPHYYWRHLLDVCAIFSASAAAVPGSRSSHNAPAVTDTSSPYCSFLLFAEIMLHCFYGKFIIKH